MRRSAVARVVAINVVFSGLLLNCTGEGTGRRASPEPPVEEAWSELDAQARCENAAPLVTQPVAWPVRCRWRQASDVLEAQAFPPPRGEPPYDNPRVEIYVARGQSREEVAHALAHELGHMRHTREPTFVPEWLAARGLPADTPDTVWTEDYAEVFAALFGPPSEEWRAPTTRPAAEALADLRGRFFS